MDVGAWLKDLGLEAFASSFAENGVDGELLVDLTNEDLKDLGVLRLADRKRLLKAIAALADDTAEAHAAPDLATSGEGERRQVTVLFADIAGYTRLSNELGAEATHAVLNRYFEAVDAIVERYGGKVDKHIGDNVMAVFGAPVAHDDDPLRALRTALDIHERMTTLSREAGRRLEAHIGIASGQVVASGTGSLAYREYTVTGDSVNLAARLQDKAGPGETLISEALRQATAGQVDCAGLGEVTVKGIADPVRVWRVEGLRGASETAQRATFVGRRGELAQFSSIVDACRAAGSGELVFLRGEAGIGKTRLAEAFMRIAVEKGFTAHKGLVLDFGVSKGQDAIRSVMRSLCGIAPGSDQAARQQAAESVIAAGLLSPDLRIFLKDLLDLPPSLGERGLYDAMDNATRNEGKRRALAEVLRAVTAACPIVILVEDVHWASPLMLAYIAKMAATVADCPALLLLTSRIEGDPLDQAWRGTTGGCPIITIDLGPLRREDALSLAGSFIDATKDFALDCVQRAEGNPLFLEQLLRNAEEIGGDEIPASIQSLVLARMDRLAPAEKQALQTASVLGQRFSLDALRHLLGDPQFTCDGLTARALIRPEGDSFLFAHALVQEGVYGSLLTARRQALHRAAAEWYRERDPVLRAEHLDRAEDPMAAAAYLDAAEAQSAAFHFETVLSLTKRGIAVAQDPATRCDLTCLRADALRNMGATEDSIAGFEAALDAADDDLRRCRAWIGMAAGLRIADRQKLALAALEKAEKAAAQLGLLSERAQIHYLRGNVYFPLGKMEACLKEHESALALARQVGSSEAEALALSGLGDAHYLRGHMRTACDQFRACVEVCRKHGYGRIEVANRYMVGWTRIFLMEFSEALEDGHASAALAAEVSHHRAEGLGLMLLGLIQLEFGRFPQAEENLGRALEITRSMSASNFETQTLGLLARLSAARGDRDQARDLAEQAIKVARQVGMTFIGPTILAVYSALTDDPGLRREALEEAESLLGSGSVAHNHIWFAHYAIDRALQAGEWDAAEHYAGRLEAYTREEPLPWPDFMIARGRVLAAWGRGDRAPQHIQELTRLKNVAQDTGLKLALPALEQALASS